MTRTSRVPLLTATCIALVGCASLPPNYKKDPRDPWERMNRTTYKVNTALDHAILRPVARGYANITPSPVRNSISNFFDNLGAPVTLGNDLLQLRFKNFAQDTGRFLLNTTVGIGGFFDPATSAGLPKNHADLGQTFGRWGMGPGPYFVFPLRGPSDVRDTVGSLGDIWMNPLTYLPGRYDKYRYSVAAAGIVDARYRLLPLDKTLDEAYDPYTLLKNAYLQRREFAISRGDMSTEEQQQQIDEENKILQEAGQDDSQGKEAPKDQPPKQP